MTAPDEPWHHAPEPTPPPDLDALRSRRNALLADAGRAVSRKCDDEAEEDD